MKTKIKVIEKIFNIKIKQEENNYASKYIFKIDKTFEYFMEKELQNLLSKFKRESKTKYIYYYLNKFEFDEFIKNIDNYLLNMVVMELYTEYIFSIIFTKNKKNFIKNYELAIKYSKDYDTEMILKTSDIDVYYNKVIQGNLSKNYKLKDIKKLSYQKFYYKSIKTINIDLIYEMLNENLNKVKIKGI